MIRLAWLCAILISCSLVTAWGEDKEEKPQAFYHQLGKVLVVNLAPISSHVDGGLIQVAVQVMVRGERDLAIITRHTPYLRNDLILLLSSKTKEQLHRAEGRELLRRQALDIIRKRVAKQEGEAITVEKVLFTQVIIE